MGPSLPSYYDSNEGPHTGMSYLILEPAAFRSTWWPSWPSWPNTNMFKYVYVSDTKIYSNISDFLKWINSDFHLYKTFIWIYSDIRLCPKKWCEYIWIFIWVKILKQIYSDIRSSQNFDECHTLNQIQMIMLRTCGKSEKTLEKNLDTVLEPSIKVSWIVVVVVVVVVLQFWMVEVWKHALC